MNIRKRMSKKTPQEAKIMKRRLRNTGLHQKLGAPGSPLNYRFFPCALFLRFPHLCSCCSFGLECLSLHPSLNNACWCFKTWIRAPFPAGTFLCLLWGTCPSSVFHSPMQSESCVHSLTQQMITGCLLCQVQGWMFQMHGGKTK